jgi:Ribonuclease HepT-like
LNWRSPGRFLKNIAGPRISSLNPFPINDYSCSFIANYPWVEWFKIKGFRNVLVHDYPGVDLERVWNIIENDLPKLKVAIDKML